MLGFDALSKQAIAALSNTISATLNVTESADTLSATGTVNVAGTANITEAADTSSAAGTVNVTGSASITEAADTASAAGTVAVSGSASITEAADTSSAAATVAITGTASITEAADTLTATGTVVSTEIFGTASVTEQADTLVATGTSAQPGGADGSTGTAGRDDYWRSPPRKRGRQASTDTDTGAPIEAPLFVSGEANPVLDDVRARELVAQANLAADAELERLRRLAILADDDVVLLLAA